jgi:hypothetical protein
MFYTARGGGIGPDILSRNKIQRRAALITFTLGFILVSNKFKKKQKRDFELVSRGTEEVNLEHGYVDEESGMRGNLGWVGETSCEVSLLDQGK